MNVNVYLEDGLAKELNSYAQKLHKSRNALIREAVKEWLTAHKSGKWSDLILNFQGVPEATPFEHFRDELLPPKENPFE